MAFFNACVRYDPDNYPRYRIDQEGARFAFDVFFDPEKRAVWNEVCQLTAFMNGDAKA